MSPLRALRRRARVDFSDYLELRRLRDEGDASPDLLVFLSGLERALPVPFARAIPDLATLAPAPEPPPWGLPREALHVLFEMRARHVQRDDGRARLMGFDLPDGPALKDWLDFMEAERRAARQAREALRDLDRRLWAVLSGNRRMPSVPVTEVLREAAG